MLVSTLELSLVEGKALQDISLPVVFIISPFPLIVVPVTPSVNPLSASQIVLKLAIVFVPAFIVINPFPLE